MKPLSNPKHEHFCQLVFEGVHPTEAAKQVGYDPDRALITGSELKRKCAARLAELENARVERSIEKAGVSKAWVIDHLIENVQMAKQAIPVYDREGNATGEYQQQLPAANKALELIGKEIGMFIERKEVRTGPLGDLTDEQLERLLIQYLAECSPEDRARLVAGGKDEAAAGESPAALQPLH